MTGAVRVSCAAFYYLDRFIALSAGTQVHLYRWHRSTNDDLQRLRGRTPQRVHAPSPSLTRTPCLRLRCCTAAFRSHVAACSDKSIAVAAFSVEPLGQVRLHHSPRVGRVEVYDTPY
jgi:hypothetical protein